MKKNLGRASARSSAPTCSPATFPHRSPLPILVAVSPCHCEERGREREERGRRGKESGQLRHCHHHCAVVVVVVVAVMEEEERSLSVIVVS